MKEDNIAKLLKMVETNLKRMCDPGHPVFRIVLERDGYGVGEDGQPEVVAFHLKLEHLSGVAHLPVAGASTSGLVGVNGGALRTEVPAEPVVEKVTLAVDEPTDPGSPPEALASQQAVTQS